MIEPVPARVELVIFAFLVIVGVIGLSLQAWLWRFHSRESASRSPSATDTND